MTHDEMIEVIQAHKDGKRIQCAMKNTETWVYATDVPSWNFAQLNYRIAREPRKCWLSFPPGGVPIVASYINGDDIEKHKTLGWQLVTEQL